MPYFETALRNPLYISPERALHNAGIVQRPATTWLREANLRGVEQGTDVRPRCWRFPNCSTIRAVSRRQKRCSHAIRRSCSSRRLRHWRSPCASIAPPATNRLKQATSSKCAAAFSGRPAHARGHRKPLVVSDHADQPCPLQRCRRICRILHRRFPHPQLPFNARPSPAPDARGTRSECGRHCRKIAHGVKQMQALGVGRLRHCRLGRFCVVFCPELRQRRGLDPERRCSRTLKKLTCPRAVSTRRPWWSPRVKMAVRPPSRVSLAPVQGAIVAAVILLLGRQRFDIGGWTFRCAPVQWEPPRRCQHHWWAPAQTKRSRNKVEAGAIAGQRSARCPAAHCVAQRAAGSWRDCGFDPACAHARRAGVRPERQTRKARSARQKPRAAGPAWWASRSRANRGWKITDANGRVILSKKFRAGDVGGSDWPRPLSVIVGNASNTRMA